MNVLINTYCNLKCSYCFADPTMKESKVKDMSITDFRKVLNFLRRNGFTEVRLIGGEPTLSPNFKEFIDLIIWYGCFKNILIFSNFTFSDDIMDFLVEKSKEIDILFLPNINEYDTILPNRAERIKSNIRRAINELPNFVEIGVNVYKPEFDFSQWEEIIKESNGKIFGLRYCIAIPTKAIVENNFDFYEYYHPFEKTINDICDLGDKYKLYVDVDCNNIPVCCFSDETIAKIYKSHPEMLSAEGTRLTCGYPVVDCRPDLTLAGCFGFYIKDAEEKSLDDFRTYQEIIDYFEEIGKNEDWIARKECLDCSRFRITGHSCSCKSTHLINRFTLEKKMR